MLDVYPELYVLTMPQWDARDHRDKDKNHHVPPGGISLSAFMLENIETIVESFMTS